LAAGQDGPIGLLGLHGSFLRTSPEFGGGPAWWTNALSYLDQTLPANSGKPTPHGRLWVVVQGGEPADEAAARRAAAGSGVGAVIVARARLDQSYTPRLVPVQ